MASRTKQKEEARARRLAEERAAAERARRSRRTRMLAGVLVSAVIVVAVIIAVSVSGGNGSSTAPKSTSSAAKQASSTVSRLLAGIPQHGNTLGSPSAKVTVTEYGDLVCPICKDFALGSENQLIANDVRAGKVKLIYRALETASATANHSMFVPSQTAARAAGQQQKAWNYIELFYHEQGDETTSYVTTSFLQGLAKQIPGLDYSKWNSDRQSSALAAKVTADENAGAAADNSVGQQPSTPTIVIQGPKGQAQPIVGPADYATLESKIKSVS